MQNKIKKIIIFVSILALSIPATLFKDPIISKAISDKSTDMILYVGEKYSIDDFFGDIYSGIPNPGKYIISNSNVLGIEGYYSKNEYNEQGWLIADGYYSKIVALHTGKATVTVVNGSNKLFRYNITVKNREITSPTQFCDWPDFYEDYPQLRMGRKPEERSVFRENAMKSILKSLNLESYNTDRERLFALAKWFYETTQNGDGVDYAVYGRPANSIMRATGQIGVILIQNMGFEVRFVDPNTHSWAEIYLNGAWYKFDAYYFSTADRFSVYNIDRFLQDVESEEFVSNIEDSKTHLPSMLVDIETKQQNLISGQSKDLPNDRLSQNVYSSDTSVVDIKDGKLIAKGAGIAIVYRYDETYCDAFYVVVEPEIKVNKKTVALKKSRKVQKSFKSLSPYRKIITHDMYECYIWEDTKLYRLEPALSSDARLSTTYNTKTNHLRGYIISADGSKKLVFDDKDVFYGDE